MREIMNVGFESAKLPENWVETRGLYRFERGGLRTGAVTRFEIPIPGNGWRSLRVELEFETFAANGPIFLCCDGRTKAQADLHRKKHFVSVHEAMPLAQLNEKIAPDARVCTVAFNFSETPGFSLNGRSFLSGHDLAPCPVAGVMEVEIWDDCLLHRVRIVGEGELPRPRFEYPLRKSSDFVLEVCVDFLDDLLFAPYTLAMFDQFFAEFARWGVMRCHWIHYGKKSRASAITWSART